MKLYWVSAIIFDNGKPRLLAMSESCLSLEKAKGVISTARNNFKVLSVWVDEIDENNEKKLVFHECYVDVLGYLDNGGK